MRRLILTLLLLTGCLPVFEQGQPEQLTLSYDSTTLTLVSDAPVERGSVGIRAASVSSVFCALPGCAPNAEGVVLLRLPERETDYGRVLIVGRAKGLVRAKAVIVRTGEKRAVETLLEP